MTKKNPYSKSNKNIYSSNSSKSFSKHKNNNIYDSSKKKEIFNNKRNNSIYM